VSQPIPGTRAEDGRQGLLDRSARQVGAQEGHEQQVEDGGDGDRQADEPWHLAHAQDPHHRGEAEDQPQEGADRADGRDEQRQERHQRQPPKLDGPGMQQRVEPQRGTTPPHGQRHPPDLQC
jgi:hypothetical protein